MRDVVALLEPAEIHAFTRGLWRSEVFKRSHDERGIVFRVIESFARYPRFFYTASREIEAPHFSPWWGGVQLREYDQPEIADLYHLHEIEHAGTMPHIAGMNPITFKNVIRDNEHEASTLSEMTVYLHHPELRAETFPHEIYVDRFLFPSGDFTRPDRRLLERWRTEPDLVRKELMYARASVITSAAAPLGDPTAFWLWKFANQGREWVRIWSDRYEVVEARMIAFREDCARSGRQSAMERHLAWLADPEHTDGTDIPFYREASAFNDVYADNKRRYASEMTSQNRTAVSHVLTPGSI